MTSDLIQWDPGQIRIMRFDPKISLHTLEFLTNYPRFGSGIFGLMQISRPKQGQPAISTA
jgi:hypothetical protein